jgi:hypothetical protein
MCDCGYRLAGRELAFATLWATHRASCAAVVEAHRIDVQPAVHRAVPHDEPAAFRSATSVSVLGGVDTQQEAALAATAMFR